jgi:hypothetical protein
LANGLAYDMGKARCALIISLNQFEIDQTRVSIEFDQTRVSCTMTLTHYLTSDLANCKTLVFRVSIVSVTKSTPPAIIRTETIETRNTVKPSAVKTRYA